MEKQAVSIITIKNILPLYRGEEQAERIELIQLEENGFNLVAAKGLYKIGDKAVYIQPDYNLSDISLFESFIRPGGDESKSMLGKVEGQPRRIRAKKFNFSLEPNGDVVYSNGILLPVFDVRDYLSQKNNTPLGITLDNLLDGMVDLVSELEITKYEEPEVQPKGGVSVNGGRKFPEGIYKTDEENINNLWNHLDKKIGYPVTLVGTEKVDGSSITIGVKNGEGFICSRNLQKPLIIKKYVGRREKTLLEKLMFWTKPDLNLYKEVENDNDFVKYGKPYLDLLIQSGEDNIVLRGELNGKTLKGSGNKLNPSSKLENNIQFFGIDEIYNGVAYKLVDELVHNFKLTYPEFKFVKEVFRKEFNSREEIEKECEAYFKENLIEGIVIRDLSSTFSAKYMCNLYDSKK